MVTHPASDKKKSTPQKMWLFVSAPYLNLLVFVEILEEA
jgi:hypothetical protein